MVSLVELRLCLDRCHDRGTCFAWPTEPEFGPICACDYLWEGRACEKRQHNPWRSRQDENSFRDEHLREHGVACGLDTIAQSCELCPPGSPSSSPELACDAAHGECEWKQRDGDSAPGCHLKPPKAPLRRRLPPSAGKGRPYKTSGNGAGQQRRRHLAPKDDGTNASAHDRALDRFVHGPRRGQQALDKAGRVAMLGRLRSGTEPSSAEDDEAGGKGRGGGKMRLTSSAGGVLERMGINDPTKPRYHHFVKVKPQEGEGADAADAAKHEADSAMAERKIWKKRALSGLVRGGPVPVGARRPDSRRRGGGRGSGLGGRAAHGAALQRRAGRGGGHQGRGAAPATEVRVGG